MILYNCIIISIPRPSWTTLQVHHQAAWGCPGRSSRWDPPPRGRNTPVDELKRDSDLILTWYWLILFYISVIYIGNYIILINIIYWGRSSGILLPTMLRDVFDSWGFGTASRFRSCSSACSFNSWCCRCRLLALKDSIVACSSPSDAPCPCDHGWKNHRNKTQKTQAWVYPTLTNNSFQVKNQDLLNPSQSTFCIFSLAWNHLHCSSQYESWRMCINPSRRWFQSRAWSLLWIFRLMVSSAVASGLIFKKSVSESLVRTTLFHHVSPITSTSTKNLKKQ
jgi:hypothetical protein